MTSYPSPPSRAVTGPCADRWHRSLPARESHSTDIQAAWTCTMHNDARSQSAIAGTRRLEEPFENCFGLGNMSRVCSGAGGDRGGDCSAWAEVGPTRGGSPVIASDYQGAQPQMTLHPQTPALQ